MELPESIRELRPHFLFWLLEKLLGGAVIAAILSALEYARSHLDFASICVVFIGSVVVLIWLDRKKIGDTPRPAKAPVIASWAAISPEEREYQNLRNKFYELRWAQQAALSQLSKMTSCPFNGLKSILEQKGFGEDLGRMLSALADSPFVELTGTDMEMRPHPARRKVIERLLDEWREKAV
jgi:hypothetical protein